MVTRMYPVHPFLRYRAHQTLRIRGEAEGEWGFLYRSTLGSLMTGLSEVMEVRYDTIPSIHAYFENILRFLADLRRSWAFTTMRRASGADTLFGMYRGLSSRQWNYHTIPYTEYETLAAFRGIHWPSREPPTCLFPHPFSFLFNVCYNRSGRSRHGMPRYKQHPAKARKRLHVGKTPKPATHPISSHHQH